MSADEPLAQVEMSEPCSTAMIAIQGGVLSALAKCCARREPRRQSRQGRGDDATTPVQKRLADGQVPKNLSEPSAPGGMRCVEGMFRV